MDILYQSDEVLELRPSHWRIFLYMGLAFTLAGCLVFFFFGQTSSLECIREGSFHPSCSLTQSLIGFTLRESTVVELIDARVVESRDSDDDLTYRIILETASGNIPLTSYFSSGKQKKIGIVNEITSFLANSQTTTLMIQQGGKSFLFFPLIFTLIGLLEIFFGVMGRHNIWHFDKVERLVTHNRMGLGGIKVTQYLLDDIADATVTRSRNSDGDTTYRIELTTRTGERIPMTSWYSSGHKKKYQAAALIQEFFGGIT